MTAPNRRLRVMYLVAVGAGSVLLSACKDEFHPQEQCPHTWDHRKLGAAGPPNSITIELAGRNTNYPEYHDCQRLVDPDGAYGPLVVAFAREGLDGFGPQLRALAASPAPEKALAAVEIWNVDSSAYAPLAIDTGFTCLYVAQQGTGWRAKLVYYGYPQPSCVNAVNLDAVSGTELQVKARATTSTDFRSEDYPPVVRWEWDGTRNQHYVGFKCDVATWCEAGLPNFVSAPNPVSPNPTWPRQMRRTVEIRGWLDEQVLAKVPTGSDPVATPATVRGTVVPHPSLKAQTLASFQNAWVPVAYVLLDGPDAAYAKKLNFVPSTAGTSPMSETNSTTVFLCWAGSGSCPGAPSNTCAASTASVGGGKWLAKYTAPGMPPIYTCTNYRRHPSVTPTTAGNFTLGTVRWRWLPNDETTWIGCPDGCCETRFGIS